MKSNLESLLQGQMEFKNGVAYLVPAKWWKQFREANSQLTNIDQLVCPTLSLDSFVDLFLLQFEEGIIAQLQHKTSYLKFNKVFLSPQPNKNVDWVPISSGMWKVINSKIKARFSLITLYDQQNPSNLTTENTIQVQIIFCSKTKSDAFVGFLPENSDAISAIRNIGFELGYVEMNNSRVIFPERSPDKPYYFCELENISLVHSQDTLFMAYNLECTERQDKNNPNNFSFGKEDQLGNSNEAMAGDLGAIGIQSFDQVRNDGTLSTGAQTPSFFGSEQENMREFRVRQLFREKKPQQIEELRSKAKKIVNGNLIPVVGEREEKQVDQELEGIVQELYEHISLHKKKTHKQKQYHHHHQ